MSQDVSDASNNVSPIAADAEPATDTKTDTPKDTSPEQKHQELHDQFIRLQADFQNYRKRMETEKDALLKYGAERTLSAILPILDNLQRGTASLSESSDPKLLYQSFRLVYKELIEGLANQGLKKMDVVGQPFDPFFHEAVQHAESTEHPENTVVQELQSGFTLYDRVLRPALVSVSTGSPSVAETTANPFHQATEMNPS